MLGVICGSEMGSHTTAALWPTTEHHHMPGNPGIIKAQDPQGKPLSWPQQIKQADLHPTHATQCKSSLVAGRSQKNQ